MPFVEIHDGRNWIRYDLPWGLTGEHGFTFRLGVAVRNPKGGNGIVFRAEPQGKLAAEIDTCAVKVLRRQDAARTDRFVNEIRIQKELKSHSIAQHFDNGWVDLTQNLAVPWMAMELGEANLRDHVQRLGPLRGQQVVNVGRQMCDALSHLHSKNIIHRDLKPDNFVWSGADDQSVLMIDFGIAKFIGEDVSGRPLDQFTQNMEFVGPVFFSSPELIAYAQDKSSPVDSRSDLFQLGKTLWFLACGKISAGIPSRRDCPLGGQLHNLVVELLQDSPQDRPAEAASVKEALESIRC